MASETTVMKLDVSVEAEAAVLDFLKKNPAIKKKAVVEAAIELFLLLDPGQQFALLSKDPAVKRVLALDVLRRMAGGDPAMRVAASDLEPIEAADAIYHLALTLATRAGAATNKEDIKRKKGQEPK